MSGWYTWQQDTLVVQVIVQPRASRDEICGVYGDQLKIRITASPVDGKANAHLTAFLAKQCGVSKSAVTLLSGKSSRHKRLHVTLQKPSLPTVLARFDNSVVQFRQN